MTLADNLRHTVPLYTARYHSQKVRESSLPKVGITVGSPRFLGYDLADRIKSLAPYGGILSITDRDEFTRAMLARLDRPGIVDHVAERLNEIASRRHADGIILCCFENIAAKPDLWCHREIVAKWWQERTGEEMLEYPEIGETTAHPQRGLEWPEIIPDPQQSLGL